MKTGLGKRIKEARTKAGITQNALAQQMRVSRAAVTQWEIGSSAPTKDKLEDLADALRCDAVWLLTGQPGQRVPTSESVLVPEYDVRVSAGDGFHIAEETKKDAWPFSRAYIEGELRLTAGQLVVLEVIGDSMEPTLKSGDRVLVNMSDTRVSQPGIFVLWDGDGTVVKRLELIPGAEPARILRISDNALHRDYEVQADETNIIGRVVWYARRM